MTSTRRNIHGLRDAMFDVLDQLRDGSISLRMARSQMEAAKTICLTVACERQELDVIQKQIEINERMNLITKKAIDHV